MVRRTPLLALAGVAALLLSRAGRARVRHVPTAARASSRRRRSTLPRGVEEYPSRMVDRRYGGDPAAAAAAGRAGDPAQIAAGVLRERNS